MPLPPDLVRASTELGGADVTVAPPPHLGAGPRDSGDLTAKVNTGLRRICGRRTVALGQKPFMIGGAAEGNAFRDFAYRQVRLGCPATLYRGEYLNTRASSLWVPHLQLNVPRPKRDGHFFPPRRATIVDRGMANNGRTGHEAYKTRGFANLPQMLAILKCAAREGAGAGAWDYRLPPSLRRKYDVEYDIVTDAQIERMDFAAQVCPPASRLPLPPQPWASPPTPVLTWPLICTTQAAVFGKNGLLIMAHGAGLSNGAVCKGAGRGLAYPDPCCRPSMRSQPSPSPSGPVSVSARGPRSLPLQPVSTRPLLPPACSRDLPPRHVVRPVHPGEA